MPKIQGYIIEKWSKAAIPNAEIKVDGVLLVKSAKNGWFTGEVSLGTHEITVSKVGYEESKQTVTFIGDTNLNIIVKPLMRAL